MTGPSSTPRGERASRPGVTWETRLAWTGEEIVLPDDTDDAEIPRPNRATRRAARRKRGRR